MRAAFRVVVTSCAALIAAAACSTPNSTDPTAATSGEARTAVVERGDLTSLVTLPATVVPGRSFMATAPYALTVERLAPRGVHVVDERGLQRVVRTVPGARLSRLRVPPGTQVPRGYPIADGRYEGFVLTARVPPALLLRLDDAPVSTRGQIEDGPGPFACRLLDPVPQQTGDATTLTCAVPQDLRVLPGMEGVIAVATDRVGDALLLPVEAVAGTTQRGTVGRIGADGRVTPVDVRLGPTDGSRIVVLAGLAEGDRVAVPAPGLLGGRDE